MKLLIGGTSSKFFHLKEFSEALSKCGVECKLVFDVDVYDGFPSRNIRNWFQTKSKFKKLVNDFQPDVVFIDRQRHFGLAAIKEGIPLLVHLRGDYWSETQWARETLYHSFPKRLVLSQWEKIAEKCFNSSTMILPICKYLEHLVNDNYPEKPTHVLQSGITSSRWYPEKGMNLKHPCVGLLQGAVISGKTKEMFSLSRVLKAMPNVTFYWVGDGQFRGEILSKLKKFENFKWLGSLQYPEKVRQFLTEIDVYALVSGIDMSPLTLQEAQLLKKPVVATNVGGIPEIMIDKETGFLVEKGNSDQLIEKISLLLNDESKSKQMGSKGRSFVEENFNWEKIVKSLVSSISNQLNL